MKSAFDRALVIEGFSTMPVLRSVVLQCRVMSIRADDKLEKQMKLY